MSDTAIAGGAAAGAAATGGTGATSAGAGAGATSGTNVNIADTGAGASATTTHWTSALKDLPAEFKESPALLNTKSPEDLATQFLNQAKVIGRKGITEPKDWNDENEVKEFINRLPESFRPPQDPKEYKLADFKDEKGELAIRKDLQDTFRTLAHKAGLTAKQAAMIHDEYVKADATAIRAEVEKVKAARLEGINQLKEELGGKFEPTLADARLVVSNLDTDGSFKKMLNDTGMGDHPVMIKALAKLSHLIKEDNSMSARTSSFTANNADSAQRELARMKSDPEIIKVLTDKTHPNHKDTTEKWIKLHGMLPRR